MYNTLDNPKTSAKSICVILNTSSSFWPFVKIDILFVHSNGGSDKQHLDTSSDSEMDTPTSMLHVNHSTTHHQSNTQLAQQQQQQHLQLNISSSNQQSSSTGGTGSNLLSAVQSNMATNHSNSGGSTALTPSKNLPQMPPLSAVAYSHLHSVIGSMPIYDMGDYQHLWF